MSARRARRKGLAAWRSALLAALCLLAGLAGAHEARAEKIVKGRAPVETRDVDTVESAFIAKIAERHVKWPESAFAEKSSPFVIGVYGKDSILAALVDTCRGLKVGEHPVEVRRVDAPADAAACHILFVPAKGEGDLARIAEACRARAVLLVASTVAAIDKGAHIGFFLEKSKLRFAIEPQGPKRVGLEVGSELLKLARDVVKTGGGG